MSLRLCIFTKNAPNQIEIVFLINILHQNMSWSKGFESDKSKEVGLYLTQIKVIDFSKGVKKKPRQYLLL